MNFDINILAENIKKYRVECNIKQYTLAERLNISPQSVSKWEQGLSIPNIENLCMLSEIFSVSVDDLLGKKTDSERKMIGIDGGGTKTEFVLFSEKGYIIQRVVLEGSNPNICGLEKTYRILKTGIDGLRSSKNKISGIYLGLAGYSSGDNGKKIKSFLKDTYQDTSINCNSDIFNVAASSTKSEKCIIAICGTGSNVCAVNRTEMHRVGGWGYLFETAGSGYAIGRDAITYALAENDGIGKETLITKLIEKRLNTTVWNAIDDIYDKGQSYVASFTNEVFEAFKAGDKAAYEIIEKNMKVLTEQINFAAEKYDCGKEVIFSGGIMKESDILQEFINRTLNKDLKIVVSDTPQIYGACVLCNKMFGEEKKDFKENFAADYKRFIGG